MKHQCPKMLIIIALLILFIGCGKVPLISENRKNFAPWEKLPEGNGITYVGKFTLDSGHDPLYLAEIKYDDDAALQRVKDTFGLTLHPTLDAPVSFVEAAAKKPSWYPLKKVTQLYISPATPSQGYCANLWVNEDEKVMILERTWY